MLIVVDNKGATATFNLDIFEPVVYVNEKLNRRNLEIQTSISGQGMVITNQFMNPRSMTFIYGDEV